MKLVAFVALAAVTAALAARLRKTRDVRLVALAAAVGVPLVIVAWVTSTSGFVWDDIKNLRQAQVEGFSFGYLFEPTSGHWAPGHRFGDWFVQRAFPFSFPAAEVLLLAGFALCLLLFHRILAELVGPGPGPILLTLLFGASVTNVGVLQWWASGLDRVPATLLSFLCVLAYLRFFKTGRSLWLAVSVLALGGAFLFYVKPVLVPLYLVLLRVLLMEPERPVRDTIGALLPEWKVWGAYAVAVGVFAVVYVSTYPTGLNETPTIAVFVRYLGLSWFRVIVPNLMGLYVPMLSRSAVGNLGVVVAQVAFVGVLVASVARARAAWRAWAFFGVAAAANIALIGITRIGFFSPRIIAWTLYYNLEIAFLFFMAAGVALLKFPPAAPPRLEGRPVAVALGVAAYLAFSLHGAVRVSDADVWIGRKSRAYLDNARAGLAAAKAAGADLALVDGVVSQDVVPYLLVPYNSFSEVFPLIDGDVGFDARGHDLFTAGAGGRILAVAFEPLAGGDVNSLLRDGSMGVVGAASVDGADDGFCVTARSVTATIGFVPPVPLASDGGLHLRLAFRSRTTSVMSILTERIGGNPPGRQPFRVVNLRPGEQETVFDLDYESARYVAVIVAPGGEVCLSRFEVGRLVDRPR